MQTIKGVDPKAMLCTGFMLLKPSRTMHNLLLDWEAALVARDNGLPRHPADTKLGVSVQE